MNRHSRWNIWMRISIKFNVIHVELIDGPTICWFWWVKLQLFCAEVIFALFSWFFGKSNAIYCWKLAGCNYVSARWVLLLSNFARLRDFLMHHTWTQGYDVYIDMPSLFVFLNALNFDINVCSGYTCVWQTGFLQW